MATAIAKNANEKVSTKETNVNSISIKAIEKNVTANKKAEQVKSIEKKVEEPVQKVVEPVLTLEQKIEKVENLKTLVDKREKLEMSRKKLQSFVVGANQFSENIVLTDENGNTFKTSNTEVFTKVVEAINTTLVGKISEIEQQIQF
ncbi:MAG: hypothetical protein C0596_06510 [Marinilabiliales bacterium]|nr:MAG: hypothetical protein C0596_06510 [Marinilabiliales bacterium]